MFGSILDRMILWELIKVFVMALLGITGILLMAGIVAEASQEGLGPAQILAAIPLLIPSTLPYTVPATTLFACCVVYGRLASDNEILAIKSSGVNILQVARPGLLLGLVASAVTLSIYWDVIPLSHRVLRQMVFDDAEELLYSMLRKQRCISFAQTPYAVWVRSVDGRKMVDPVIKCRSPQGKTTFVAQAKEAELHVDMATRKLTFLLHFGCAATPDGGNNVNFDAREVTVDLPPNFGNESERRPRDMTWGEMLDKRTKLREAEEKYQQLIIKLQSAGGSLPLTPDLDADTVGKVKIYDLGRAQLEQEYTHQQILWIDVELQMRPALSLGCFCFILVGCPVGIWFSRSDYLSSFIVCFLPIVIVYYPLTLCGAGMAKEGRMDPMLMMWGANLLMVGIGSVMFWRLLKN